MNFRKRRKIIDKSRKLRKKGCSLGEIANRLVLPRTTVYGYVRDISLTAQQKAAIRQKARLLKKNKPNPRKGKCIPGRGVSVPDTWNADVVHVVSHFMFDGHVSKDGCIYYSRSACQIDHLKELMYRVFKIRPKYYRRKDGVNVIAFYNVELVKYINAKMREIFPYLINKADREEKRIFIQSFFDDEGNVYYGANKKRIRGYQKSLFVLRTIRNILREFEINGRIYQDIEAIEITGKENLVHFAEEINFSSLICMNPDRKNSIWRKAIPKREILNLALSSYKN